MKSKRKLRQLKKAALEQLSDNRPKYPDVPNHQRMIIRKEYRAKMKGVNNETSAV